MDLILTYDRDKMDELTSKDIMKLIEKHKNEQVPQYQQAMDYYLGNHAIKEKERKEDDAPNAQTVCNHAKDISDTASSYFLGTPLTYTLKKSDENQDAKGEAAFDNLLKALEKATTDDDDQENSLMLSICGKTYEYVYIAENKSELREQPIDPQNAFIVYDQSIEHNELFGVYYYEKKNDAKPQQEKPDTYLIMMTDNVLKYYKIPGGVTTIVQPYEEVPHNLGRIPLIEYKNNRFTIGDFSQQIGLIDAYNTMTSDRINDKEQFIDAILVIYGALLGDDEEETDEAIKKLKKKKLLELPEEGSRAEYLIRQLDENGMETLREALKEDIYTFSHVPNLTDENFAGNSSGVAMEYKLLGLEMLTKTKERWYRRGLRKRLEIFLYFLSLKGSSLSADEVEITFSRSLPKNLVELSQIVNNLADDVTLKTRLALLPFIEDPQAEAEALEAEKQANIEKQQELFKMQSTEPGQGNEPPEGGEGAEGEE